MYVHMCLRCLSAPRLIFPSVQKPSSLSSAEADRRRQAALQTVVMGRDGVFRYYRSSMLCKMYRYYHTINDVCVHVAA
jgi:hypothetical protein